MESPRKEHEITACTKLVIEDKDSVEYELVSGDNSTYLDYSDLLKIISIVEDHRKLNKGSKKGNKLYK